MHPFLATYRLQLGPELDFDRAATLVPYLKDLGVSHLYLSPIFQARAGSTHGYDVVDPTRISTDLGGEKAFRTLASCGLGIILDLVPNHMAADDANPFWRDPELRHRFFDIDSKSGFRRRFFDVDDLVGVRVEDPEVFQVTHHKALELLEEGLVDGLRIDHVDGLADPTTYLARLASRGAAHVWVEKILEPGEDLRPWTVEGTTGYDFLNEVTALFVEPRAEQTLTELAGDGRAFAEIAYEAKLEQALTTFTPEVRKLGQLFPHPEIAEALACLPVYRTYVDPQHGAFDEHDRGALSRLPEPIRSAMTLEEAAPAEFITRFQQTSGAVMAKGVEDTALYRYVRLLALNEVGGDPQIFGTSVEQFHLANAKRNTHWPMALLASQTHDTKRSGDVRARLLVLSYIADEWTATVRHWHEITRPMRTGGAPDWTEELFIYQTLIGAWPMSIDRLGSYLRKALREMKRHTNWVEPNVQWESRVLDFCEGLLHDPRFLRSFGPLLDRVALAGERIALAQLVLRLSAPGLPDIYQGDEQWNYSLVDPDNRRPVDFASAASTLQELRREGRLSRLTAKPFVTTTMLGLRQRKLRSMNGRYQSIISSPTTCAYHRGEDIVVAVALRGAPLEIEPPGEEWINLLQPLDDVYSAPGIAVYERT